MWCKIILYIAVVAGIAEAYEYCNDDYAELDYCYYGCCGDSCCPNIGLIVGAVIGGLILLVSAIVVCVCIQKQKSTSGHVVHPVGTGPSVIMSNQTYGMQSYGQTYGQPYGQTQFGMQAGSSQYPPGPQPAQQPPYPGVQAYNAGTHPPPNFDAAYPPPPTYRK